MLVQILQNAALISFVAFGVFWVWQRSEVPENVLGQVVLGLNFGLVAFLVTATPIVTEDGATIDARAGPVILSGIVAGPIAAFIAAFFGAIARAFIGGSFAFSGVLVYFLYAGAACSIWYYRRRHKGIERVSIWTVGSGAFASVVAASLMFFVIQPRELALHWLFNDLPVIALANLLSVALAGVVCAIAIAAAERKNELARALETLNLAKSAGGIGIWTFDPRHDRAEWDETNRMLHGFQGLEAGGEYADWEAVVHPDDLPRVNEEFQDALSGKAEFDTTYRVKLADGTERHLKANAAVVRDSTEAPIRIVGANLDLTPLVEMDSALIEAQEIASQAQKLEAIGELTGGVAHDFNNLLSIILGNVELARDRTNDRTMAEFLDQAEAAALLGSDLTRNMLAFARRAELNPTLLDVNTIILDAQTWMVRTLRDNIDVDLALGADVCPVFADKSGIETCLLNLLLNAKDALNASGTIRIETSHLEVKPNNTVTSSGEIAPGEYTILAISDNGRGISPEIADQIFDPFFTTKEAGKGSGLGLSMVQGFMRQSGGAVSVNSRLGQGTTIELLIPARCDATVANEADTSVPPSPPSGARILLIEDQEDVRRVMKKTLEAGGYEVIEASTGDEASGAFSEAGPFDLVITDMVMPGKLQGLDVAELIRSKRPSQKIIFMSGYASEAQDQRNTPKDDLRLMKPVRRTELIRAIEEVLSSGE